MRVLVTGAAGLLGSAVASLASEGHEVYSAYNGHDPRAGTPLKLDLLDAASIRRAVADSRPDAVVHAAALTDVDRCEREQDLADRVNHLATKSLASAAREAGAYFLYVSTDYVFDGEKGRYREDDPTGPISFYGLSKLGGERAVEASGAEYCVARGSVVYGARPAAGKVNFALWVVEQLRTGKRVKVLRDQYVSPTLNSNLARMILEAVEKKVTGTVHMAGGSRVGRHEFAAALADAFGLDPSLIDLVAMGDMNWLARRPRDSSLDVSKAASTLAAKPLPLSDAISELKQAVDAAGEE